MMRVEIPTTPTPWAEANKNERMSESKALEKTSSNGAEPKEAENIEDAQLLQPPVKGSASVYSPASLKSAVDYHAKFLTVAESNIKAAYHISGIPQSILDSFKG
jgi:hypothetical protein